MFNANSASEPVGTLDVALGHAARLLERDAALAAEQAGEVLKAVPDHPHARLILGPPVYLDLAPLKNAFGSGTLRLPLI
jgi:hypothetical protein